MDVERKKWVLRHYTKGSDVLDAEVFAEGLSEDVRIVTGQGEASGLDEARAALERLRAAGVLAMRHDIQALWEPEPGVVVVEATVTYSLDVGALSPLPVVTIFRWRGAEVSDVRVYMDSTPLLQAATARRTFKTP